MSQKETLITDLLREIVAYCREAGHDWANLAEAEAAISATQPAKDASVTSDQVIELVQCLEQLRAVTIAEAVQALPVGGVTESNPTQFHAGYQLACEEIIHRLKTEEWDLCATPAGTSAQPAQAAQSEPPCYIGACITDGRLHAIVMRKEKNGHVTVIATAEIDEKSLHGHDCIAELKAAQGAGEVVAAQCRFTGQTWGHCEVEHARMVLANPGDWPGYEVRLLTEAAQPQSAAPEVRGTSIKANMFHDAGAYAQCSYCQRYSDDPKTLSDRQPACDCGKKHGWSGSFKAPTAESKWSDHNRPSIPTP